MWTALISLVGALLVPFVKWIIEKVAGKKMSDAEFMEHIRAHQLRRKGVADQATDFEKEMDELKKQEETSL